MRRQIRDKLNLVFLYVMTMAASGFPLLIFIFLGLPAVILGQDQGSDSFFQACPASRCSKGGPTIRFPFHSKSQPPYCGLEGFDLSCMGEKTVLNLPFSGDLYVKKIDYRELSITVSGPESWSRCPLQNYLSLNLSNSSFEYYISSFPLILLNCTNDEINDSLKNREEFLGPISCLSDGDYSVYAMDGANSIDKVPSACPHRLIANISDGGAGYISSDPGRNSLRFLGYLMERKEFALGWNDRGIGERCNSCEDYGNFCGFNATSNRTFCFTPPEQRGPNIGLITGASIGGAIVLALMAIGLYIYRRPQREKKTQLKVEKFLADYKTLNPTRYSYSDIQKITQGFKNKLGQGGFGCVYKGELPRGIPVAVKMLDRSKGRDEEFMNEVAAIVQIHHTNVVRLLGLCSEGSQCALVYEFMPNGSLEKFICSKEARKGKRLLSCDKLQEIAVGIAHGIEYLHQGCNQRILHFDIKPHNILLDHNFHPKISDFGLAKLCSKDQSIVSVTTARGTTGYMAPELFSRNFGMASYKSDVYSFGMLLLEMVVGRKNTDTDKGDVSQTYFMETIYDQLIQGKQLQVEVEGDEEIKKKLAIVALWCIQWSPADRPTMQKVVHMLEGNLDALQIPPKPFISATDP